MKVSSLKDVIDNHISIRQFLMEIEEELKEYSKAKEIRGSSQRIRLKEDVYWALSRDDVVRILELFINGDIDALALEYICDGIELSDSISYDDRIGDIIFEFANPDINGSNTKEKAKRIIESL